MLGLAASGTALAADAKSAAPVPFAPGDVVVGCTQLNDPNDDHAGRGRLLHFDSRLRLRNTLWLDDTTHIVQGVRFAPDGTLWAFDPFAYKIVRFDAQGRRLENFAQAPARAFGHVSFAPDGRFFLGENLVGEASRVRLKTTLPYMPGTKRFGDGHLFAFSPQGRLLKEFATATHGGMGGFQGLTSSALAPDGRTVFYTSESGPKVMRFDVKDGVQRPDFVAFPENSGQFFFDVAFDRSGQLLAVRGMSIDVFDAGGKLVRSLPLAQFGWASLSVPVTKDHVYVANWFNGELSKIDLRTGAVLATTNVGGRKCLAGVAEAAPG